MFSALIQIFGGRMKNDVSLIILLISTLRHVAWLDAAPAYLSCSPNDIQITTLHGFNSDGIPVVGTTSIMFLVRFSGECNCGTILKPYQPLNGAGISVENHKAYLVKDYTESGIYHPTLSEVAGNGHQVMCSMSFQLDDSYTFELSSPEKNRVVLEYALGKDVKVLFGINSTTEWHDALNEVIDVVDDYLLVDMTFETYYKFQIHLQLHSYGNVLFANQEVQVHPDMVYGILMNPAYGSMQITGNIIMQDNHTMEKEFVCSITFLNGVLMTNHSASIVVGTVQYTAQNSFYNITVENFTMPDNGLDFYYNIMCSGTAKVGNGYILRNNSVKEPIYLGHSGDNEPIENFKYYPGSYPFFRVSRNSLHEFRGTLLYVVPTMSFEHIIKKNDGGVVTTYPLGFNQIYVQEKMLEFSITHVNTTIEVVKLPTIEGVRLPCDSVLLSNASSNFMAILSFEGPFISFEVNGIFVGPFPSDYKNIVAVYTVSPAVLPALNEFKACSYDIFGNNFCTSQCEFHVQLLTTTTASPTTTTSLPTTLPTTSMEQITDAPTTTAAPTTLTSAPNLGLFSLFLGFCDSVTTVCAVKIDIDTSQYSVCTLKSVDDILETFNCSGSSIGTCGSQVSYVVHVSLLDGTKGEISLGCSKKNDGTEERKHLVIDMDTISLVTMNFQYGNCAINSSMKLVKLWFAMSNVVTSDFVVNEYDKNDEVVSSKTPVMTYSNHHYVISIDVSGVETYHEICITLSNSNSYLIWCKYVLSLEVSVSSAKIFHKAVSSGYQFDRLFDVSLAVTGSAPIGESFDVNWEVGKDSLTHYYGNPVSLNYNHNEFQDGKYVATAHVISPNSIQIDISGISFDLITGINATVSVESTHKVNEPVEFLVSIYGPKACVFLEFGDSSSSNGYGLYSEDLGINDCASYVDDSTSLSWMKIQYEFKEALHHVYNHSGLYTARFRVINSIHNQDEQLSIFVTELDCYAPTVTLKGLDEKSESSISYTRSESFKVESDVLVDCSNHIFHASWKISYGDEFKNEFRSEDIKLDGETSLYVPKNTAPYGLLYICVDVKMAVNENIFSQKCGYLKITAAPLNAVIKNGNEVIRGSDVDYTLDASNSVDPDIGSLTGVEVHFLCRSMNDPPFNVSLIDITNKLSFSSIPDTPPTGVYYGCYGTGPGRLKQTEDEKKAILFTKHIKPNEKLEITLYLWKQDEFETKPRISIFKQYVTVIEGSPPAVSLRDDGKESINYNMIHNVVGQCDQSCSDDLTWYWNLYQCESKDAKKCVVISDEEFNRIRSTKRTDKYYSVRSQSYNPSSWYKLVFRGYRGYTFGEAVSIFYVNSPPKNGNCFLDKESGVALVDSFTLTCHEFEDDDLPLSYKYFIKSKDSERVLHTGTDSVAKVLLPCGTVETNFTYNVSFTVADRRGGAVTLSQAVRVRLSENTDSLFQDLSGNDSLVHKLAESGDVKRLTSTILLYSSVLNENSKEIDRKTNETNMTSLELNAALEKKVESMKVRQSFIENLEKVTPRNVAEMSEVVGTLAMVTENPYELNEDSQKKVMNQCEDFTSMLEGSSDVGTDEITAASAGILSAIGDVVSVSASITDVNVNNSKNDAILATSQNVEKLKEEAEDRISTTNKLVAKLQKVLLTKTIPGAELLKIDGNNIKIAAGLLLATTRHQAMNVGDIGADVDMGMMGSNETVSVKLKNYKHNIYTSDVSASKMNSQITGLNIGSADGTDFDISSSSVPIVLKIKNNPTEKKANNNTMSVEENGEQWSFQLIKMSNNSLRMKIDMKNDSVSVTAYLRHNKRPTPEKYDYKWILPDNSSCSWLNETLHKNEQINLFSDDPSEYACKYEPWVIFLSDSEKLDGDYYLGLHYAPPSYDDDDNEQEKSRRRRSTDQVDVSKVDQEFCVVVLPPPPTPAPTDPPGEWKIQPPTPSNDSLEFSVDLSNSKCLFWNETSKSWSSNGCYVGPNTTPEKTECICDHLTDFGGDVVVAPAPIDFDKVFAGLKNLGDNLGVLMVILTILLLYILLLVWARKKDRRDKNLSGPIIIDYTKDNDQKHGYIATVVTGAGFGAGTSANVYMTLCGSRCDSKIIHLASTDERKVFEARSTTTFRIILPDSIGQLEYIRIFHDNSGRSPSWYLRNIVITETSTAKQYPFVYDSWLAVESDDGQIEALLPVANEKDLAGFHIVFASTAAKGILDGHIWFSIFTRPKFSPFTRVQRLSCCLALIYLTMVTNAMFFGVGEAGPKILIRLGNMVINITGIIIGIESSLIVVPPSVLIIEIFRRLAPKKKKKKQKKAKAGDVEELEEFEEKLEQEASRKPKEKKPFMFPYQFKYLAYTIIFLASFGSALFTFFYSMMWGKKKSNQWLGSMFAGFFQSVFVIQPIKAAFTAALFAMILRSPIQQEHGSTDDEKNEKEEKDETEKKEDEEEDIDGEDDIISADEVPIVRPSDSMLERARKKKIKEKMTRQVIVDILTYFVFLWVVISLAYLEKDSNAFYFRQDLRNMFLEGTYVSEDVRRPFHGASNPGYFYVWVRDTMVPSIFVGPWYNDRLPKSLLYTENREDLLISIPRFRQQRVQKDSCTIHNDMKDIVNNNCYDAYSFGVEETRNFETAWEPLNDTRRYRRDASWIVDKSESMIGMRRSRRNINNYRPMSLGKGAMHRRRQEQRQSSSSDVIFFVDPSALLPDGSVVSCSERWTHHTASELRGFPYFGKFSTYAGSGYTANLGYNEETAWTVIADLHAHNWIDRQTRAVFVEFTVYNANINLFATAFLFMEILPIGAGFPHCEFKIFNGYRYALNANISNRLLELLFVCFVFYFTGREIKKALKMRLSYLKSFFNLIEVALLPLYVMMFGLIIFRWLSTAKNIAQFKENPKDFVSFQYSASADEMLQGVIGIAVFLLNIKFLKYFQFAKSFYKVGLVMKSFFVPLLGFCVSFAIYFIMFASAAHLGFGANSENYHTFVRTVVTQFLHLLGATDFEESRNASYLFGPFYYVAYSTFVLFITFNVFMAIICGAIDEDYEEEFEKNLGDIQVVEYLMNSFKRIAGFEQDDDQDADDMFDGVTQDYDKMDKKMNHLERTIDLMVLQLDQFETEPTSEDVLIERFSSLKHTIKRENIINAWT